MTASIADLAQVEPSSFKECACSCSCPSHLWEYATTAAIAIIAALAAWFLASLWNAKPEDTTSNRRQWEHREWRNNHWRNHHHHEEEEEVALEDQAPEATPDAPPPPEDVGVREELDYLLNAPRNRANWAAQYGGRYFKIFYNKDLEVAIRAAGLRPASKKEGLIEQCITLYAAGQLQRNLLNPETLKTWPIPPGIPQMP